MTGIEVLVLRAGGARLELLDVATAVRRAQQLDWRGAAAEAYRREVAEAALLAERAAAAAEVVAEALARQAAAVRAAARA